MRFEEQMQSRMCLPTVQQCQTNNSYYWEYLYVNLNGELNSFYDSTADYMTVHVNCINCCE